MCIRHWRTFADSFVFEKIKSKFPNRLREADCLTVILMSYIMKLGQLLSCSSCIFVYNRVACLPGGFVFAVRMYLQVDLIVDQYII